jgi:gliding motility-associated-like protein
VNQPTLPTFDPIAAICSGGQLNPLPTTSTNGVTGTWSPALNNTQTTTYTFTPNVVNPSPTNLVVNGDFTAGNSGFNSDYQYITNAGLNGVQKAYGIVAAANSWFQFFPACTSNAPSGGNMMVVDGSTSNGGNDIVWSQTVTVQPNQTYNFSYWLQTVSMPNNAIAEVTINGVSIGMTTAPGNNCETGQYSYTWNSGTSTTAQIAIYDRNIQSNGNDFSLDDISLIQATFIPCPTTTTLTITVNQPVTSTFNAIPELCSGGTAPELPTNSLEGFTGTWSPAVIDNTTSGTYTFIPDANQCAINGNLVITVQNSFDFDITGNCVGNEFILEVTAVNNTFDVNTASYNWFTIDQQLVGTNSSTFNVSEYLSSTIIIEELPITFSVTVTDANGCTKNESITLDRIFCGIQKGISVNNDGNNDFFDLTQLNVKNLSIFNRYGMKVYTKNQYRNEWKGQTDNGDELPDGTYYYVIEFNSGDAAKTGWIYVNREQ